MDIGGPDSLARVPAVMSELSEHGHVIFETTHLASDGTQIPSEVNTHMFELDGETRYLSVARDITERVRAEAVSYTHLRAHET